MVDDSRRDARCNELDFTACAAFPEVAATEYRDIHERRKMAGQPPDPAARPHDISGIALSGGGIRSATFNLGILQALHRWGLLGRFDYLCTTSGGGFVGGWWSAWLAREPRTDIFPPPEQLELDRHHLRHDHQKHEADKTGFQYEPTQISDSALNADRDPIHHLRLFGNYITPKKGLFSADTWRAIAIVSRNILLTWLILIPILLATVLAGQAYFALIPGTSDAFLASDASQIKHPDLAQACGIDVAKLAEHPASWHLEQRLWFALAPPAVLLLIVFVCVLLWMLTVPQYWQLADYLLVLLSAVVAGLLVCVLVGILPIDFARIPHPSSLGRIVIGILIVIFGLLLWLTYLQQKHGAKMRDIDYWRNRLVRLHAKYLLGAVVLTGILLFAGFGHDIVAFLIGKTHLAIADRVARAGGWGAAIMTALGSIYTAISASPKGGADSSEKKQPSKLNKIAYALVPFLLVLLLALLAAAGGHALYRATVVLCSNSIPWIIWGAFASATLCLALCLYEFRPTKRWPMLSMLALWAAIAIFIVVRNRVTLRHDMAIAACMFVGLFMRARLRTRHREWHWWYTVVPIAVGIVTYFVNHTTPVERQGINWRLFEILVAIGLLYCFTLLLFELGFGQGANKRSFGLLFIAFLTLTLIGAAPYLGDAYQTRWIAMTGLIACTLGWVIALGWLADPNALSGHGFYKSRLVRAYLGASNPRRAFGTKGGEHIDVTDAVPGDDVRLVNLRNCETGAPFHLITTTLNLVGGQDLATAQRSSDMFTLSKRHCGSLRTGFRPTDEWMCGTMSLGTAVAVSGAAASPNMGAQSPSAAMAMLMTLFNVRLGYWAPTPDRSYWRNSATRLWPFYTVQELLSQTNDLLPYCYLTDGGHYDNTSLYPLFARGTRFILVSDCGYDPPIPTFDDLGAVIRRARIDFGTEVTIDLEPLRIPDKLTGEPLVHFIVGRICYSERHAADLGWNKDEPRDGVLLCVKPNRAADVTADVRTYGWKNTQFPQTPTGNQFYDEAQFESYRKLGEETIDVVMQTLKASPGALRDVFKTAEAGAKLPGCV